MKKFIALLLAAVMLMGILASCGNTESKPDTTQNNQPATSILSGMLVLSAQVSFKIGYDQNGTVMEVTGVGDEATSLLEKYDCTNKTCATVVEELLVATAEATLLRDAHNIVLKLAVGSVMPSETFLDGLAKTASETAADNGSAAYVVVLGLDDLDAEGYISLENAQKLLLNHLSLEKFDSFTGDTSPRNDCYTVTVVYGETEGYYSIDAVTGLIAELSADEMGGEPEYVEEEMFEEEQFEEEFVETEEETTPEEV